MEGKIDQERKYLINEFKKSYRMESDDEYKNFSAYFQSLFINDYDEMYSIACGNYQRVNLWMLDKIEERIKRHPILFKLLFKI